MTVTAAEKKDGGMVVTLAETSDGEDVGSDTFAVSDKGVFNVRTTSGRPGGNRWDHNPPLCVLKLPHRPGNTWAWDCPAQPGGLVGSKATKAAHGPEEVAVPAGKYTAIRVEHKDAGTGDTATFWYAPGVGLVRMACKDVVQELESFTPGRR